MKCCSILASAVTWLLLSVAGMAQAAVIDFEDVPLGGGDCNYVGLSLDSRGFTFTGNPADPVATPFLYVCNPGILQSNTSAALINTDERSILTMTKSDGSSFSLSSFYAGGRTENYEPSLPVIDYSVAFGIDIVGHLVGGGTVFTSVVLDSEAPYDWSLFVLPASFTDLVSVVFTAQGDGDIPEFLIDDIVVDMARPVPEPASLALLGTALFGLVLAKRSGAAKRRRV
ncbi:PEP-CTERM sorting domain-containing protein [Oryzisolibacter sp. LB2S]|uniref:PEP-CTERM sorting domain-containing protein n=1 Tax=Alicycliphilus soli TaxID=3228789 RepID=UPI003457D598